MYGTLRKFERINMAKIIILAILGAVNIYMVGLSHNKLKIMNIVAAIVCFCAILSGMR